VSGNKIASYKVTSLPTLKKTGIRLRKGKGKELFEKTKQITNGREKLPVTRQLGGDMSRKRRGEGRNRTHPMQKD